MRKFRVLITIISVLALLFSVGACTKATKTPSGDTVVRGGVFHDWFTEDPPGFDPQTDTTLMVYNLARNMFNTLVRYKTGSFDLEPELLAEMPKVSADGLTYSFTLKKGVKFSDGKTTLTAKDVKYTIERMLDPNGTGASGWLFEPIRGATDIEDGKATELAGFKATDDYSFQLTLEKPYAPFLQMLAVPSASILPADYAQAKGKDFDKEPMGTGPFKLKEWVHDDHVTLEKNKSYFEKGLPYLDSVEYRIIADDATGYLEFKNGNLDLSGIPDAEFNDWTTSGKYTIDSKIALNTYYLMFNVNDPVLKDVNVRKAIIHAIDRQKILDTILLGQGVLAKTFVTPGIPGVDPAAYPGITYDPAKAKEYLAKSGKKNVTVQTWQIGTGSPADTVIAMKDQLKQVGITLKVQMMDRTAFRQARRNGTVPMNYGNWWADYPDSDNYLYTYFHSAQSKGMSSNLNLASVDKLLDEGQIETDAAKRAAAYKQAEQIIVYDEAAVFPLFHLKSNTAIQKNVNGLDIAQTGVYSYKTVYKTK
ncbi:MAG: ABC transporter substrate-binding protein [Bacillota bacterium]